MNNIMFYALIFTGSIGCGLIFEDRLKSIGLTVVFISIMGGIKGLGEYLKEKK